MVQVPARKVWLDDYLAVEKDHPANQVTYRSVYKDKILFIMQTKAELTYHVWLEHEQLVWKRVKARQPVWNMHITLPKQGEIY